MSLTLRQRTQILQRIQRTAKVSLTDAKKIAAKAVRISEVIRAYAPDWPPFDYQAEYLDDYVTRMLIYKKPRQVGCSHMAAQKALVRACVLPRHLTLLLSLNLADAKNKIEYAEHLYDAIAGPIGAPAIDNKSKMEISLANGSKIMAVYTPRGKAQADIVLDEYAHFLDPEKIWQATLPIMIHQDSRLIVMSTPLHSHTAFNQIWEGEGGKYKNFVRRTLYWWDCPVHCVDVEQARKEIIVNGQRIIPTEEAIEKFGSVTIKEIFDSMPLDQFETEFELKEIDDDTALLPWDMILRCSPTGEDSVDQYVSLHELKEKTKGLPFFAGMDIGRHHDAGELTVLVEEEAGHLVERHYQTFIDTPFRQQEDYAHDVLSLPNCRQLGVDATGMGEPIGENLQTRWGHRVTLHKFSGPHVGSLATMTKMYMEKGKVTFLSDRDRNAQMHSIKKQISDSGHRVSYMASRGKGGTSHRHHGDVFWARAMAIYEHADVSSLGEARVRFI